MSPRANNLFASKNDWVSFLRLQITTKQGVEGASVSSEAQRLCDWCGRSIWKRTVEDTCPYNFLASVSPQNKEYAKLSVNEVSKRGRRLCERRERSCGCNEARGRAWKMKQPSAMKRCFATWKMKNVRFALWRQSRRFIEAARLLLHIRIANASLTKLWIYDIIYFNK